ncbi:monocarboxylate transporter 7-like isoform X1 [Seriola lalandi dorsalis]|uniref:monocarboxylate transporter 7-like isoform X1 n=1 Tax=Seriola lalandi dorsalis TaxID=1841481 RepID=UPI000C6F6D5C|nr:monocarboxylate transporter 7-like isoform X1 [Seriola lalandi dorsalis]XP_056221263.1 monocarboxylate transporter 7-like isoform X1 [Seriola aureovittata]XP_056221264.1 monocarboxylate transporter 7-like isoform X1 [Seriola aureovittata]XP_056221266.1 monocarboxylate transporter 7-like isoform X1 [Seriola aureovittata]
MALCGAKGLRFLGPNVYPEAPDGGWGWVVAVAFFLVEVFTYGTIKIFGIFLQDLMEEFGETNSRVSWIVSICVFVMTFNGPLSSVMTNRFGFQLVVMIGGLLISTGTIATSFTNSINQMYITYGLVAGLGYCLTFLPTVTILSKYFSRRRALVTAVASMGESLSMFALAPAFSALRDHIGWRNTMAVIGALQSSIIICGVLLRPIILKPRASHETETDRLSSRELDVLSAQENVEDINPEDSMMNKTSHAPNTSSSLDNEPTRGSLSTGDSGVQSLKDTDDSSPEEKTLLHKEASSETEQKFAESSKAEIREPETEEGKKKKDAEKQGMKDEDNKSRDESLSAKNSKLLDFSILRECSFILYSLFGLFATLGFFAPQLYIIELSVSRGVERDSATYMLSTMAVAEILGRFSIGWILTRKQFRKKKLLVLLACVIIMTADLVGFTLVTEFYGLAVCCALYGFFMGTLACTHIPMLAEDDVVGIDRMSSAAGVYVFIHSFAGLAGPPLGGVLVDVTKNYGSAFYSCAIGMALSAVFLGLVKPAKRGLLCRKRNSKQPEDIAERNEDSEEQSGEHKLDRTDGPHDCAKAEVILDRNHAGATRDVQEVIRFA